MIPATDVAIEPLLVVEATVVAEMVIIVSDASTVVVTVSAICRELHRHKPQMQTTRRHDVPGIPRRKHRFRIHHPCRQLRVFAKRSATLCYKRDSQGNLFQPESHLRLNSYAKRGG